jgi:hypothetical protein
LSRKAICSSEKLMDDPRAFLLGEPKKGLPLNG